MITDQKVFFSPGFWILENKSRLTKKQNEYKNCYVDGKDNIFSFPFYQQVSQIQNHWIKLSQLLFSLFGLHLLLLLLFRECGGFLNQNASAEKGDQFKMYLLLLYRPPLVGLSHKLGVQFRRNENHRLNPQFVATSLNGYMR